MRTAPGSADRAAGESPAGLIERIIRHRLVTIEFQPVVRVATEEEIIREPIALPELAVRPDPTVSPYELLRRESTPIVADESFLRLLAAHLEERADSSGEPFVMFVVTPHGRLLSGQNPARLRSLGRKASLLLAFTGGARTRRRP